MILSAAVLMRTGMSWVTGAAGFAMTHWKPILGLVVLSAYSYGIYAYGEHKADAKWVKVHNTKTTELNTKITEIEADSRTAVAEVTADNAELAKELARILGKAKTAVPPSSYARDVNSKPLKCPDGTAVTQVYLGPDFTAQWNAMNEKGNEK